jgi:hypothetical protein
VILLNTVGLKRLVGTGAVMFEGNFLLRPFSRWLQCRVWLDAFAQDLPGWQTLNRFFKRAECNSKTSGRRKCYLVCGTTFAITLMLPVWYCLDCLGYF